MSLTDPDPEHDPAPPTARDRIDRARLRLRRTVLRRRRSLAALLACVAVGAALTATRSPDLASVPVLVAARDLPPGATLAPSDLVLVDFRPGTPPASALDDADDLAGRVLAAPVTAGEPITPVRLVGPDLAEADPGRTAVPVRLPDAGLVSLLEVGDRLDLLAVDPEDGDLTTLAHDVPVLALPTREPGSSTLAAQPGSLLVVGLTPQEVAPVTTAALVTFVTYTWSSR